MISIKESEDFLHADVEICVHMITFVALWKMKKFPESANHIEIAAEILNQIIQRIVDSKMSKNSSQNLYCLVVMSLAALKIKVNNDFKNARELCEDCKSQLQANSLCYKLLSDYISKISGKKASEED